MVSGRAGSAEETVRAALRVLADLSPSGEQRTGGLSIPTQWFRWLPAAGVRMLAPSMPGAPTLPRETPFTVRIERDYGERLAAVDQIRPGQRSLRVGWLFVAGRTELPNGQKRRVFHPLVTMPVRVQRAPLMGAFLHPAGDVELSELIADPDTRSALESQVAIGGGALDDVADAAIPAALLHRMPRLRAFARDAAEAAGFAAHQVDPVALGPEALMRRDELVVVAGLGAFAVHDVDSPTRSGSLLTWAAQDLGTSTAFHALYADAPAAGDASAAAVDDDRDTVESPYLLTPAQREAVGRTRRDPVTLISGAPGTGKSHTVAAVACDALARGERVLVVAKTDATVDALLDLLERAPGPVPVVFGSNERREALADRLAAGQLQPERLEALEAAQAHLDRVRARRDRRRQEIVDLLAAETSVTRGDDGDDGGDTVARTVAPRLFDPAADLDDIARRLAVLARPARGWWARRRRRKARRALDGLVGARPESTLAELGDALDRARVARVSAELVAAGGLDLADRWERLQADDDEVRRAVTAWLGVECRSYRRIDRSTLPAIAALATALRSGRAARRAQLRTIGDGVSRALPLWVGTLADVDDLLPAAPALFDLVVLDEASSIDQPLAASALLRGARGVVVGDPKQLRHVSFTADARQREVVAGHGLDQRPLLAARLDVRRNSVFDVAAAVAPVVTLDEHFRSDPHLVEFVARRLYGGTVKVATRSPATHGKDCVEVVRLEGKRDRHGVVQVEVDRVLADLEALRQQGAGSVGVVTPFRAQADALEEAVLAAFTADDLEALDLRVGTVHAFQGNERDVVLASLAIGPDDGASSWRFVDDPHLFAVFVTRARRQLRFLVSCDPPPGGLVADYLAQVDTPPGPPAPAGSLDGWAESVAADLEAAGIAVSRSYPTGRHVVDVCVPSAGRAPASIECEVHPDGPDAHVERHLSLRRAGWTIHDGYASRWSHRPGELVVDLLTHLRN